MQDSNPYQQPSESTLLAGAATGLEPTLVVGEPQARPAAAGIQWLVDTGRLFSRHWGVLLLFGLLLIGVQALSIIPFLGIIAMFLPFFLIPGLFVMIGEAESRGTAAQFSDVFRPFSTHLGPLILLLLLLVLVMLGVMLVLGVVMFISVGSMPSPEMLMNDLNNGRVGAQALLMLLGGLLGVALFILVGAAFMFAPALVVLGNLSAGAAVAASMRGVLRNILPFLVNGLVLMLGVLAISAVLGVVGYLLYSLSLPGVVLMVPAVIIGVALMLVLMPLAYVFQFAIFRDIYRRA